MIANTQRGRARRAAAAGCYTVADVEKLRSYQNDKCVYCSKTLNGEGHLDHIVALINGGSNWPSNLQLTCNTCNLKKGRKDAIAFAQENGLLL